MTSSLGDLLAEAGQNAAHYCGLLALVVCPALVGWLVSRFAADGAAMRAHRARGRITVHDSEELVVLDELQGGGALRMLVFKSDPTLRQSEVRVCYAADTEQSHNVSQRAASASVQHQPVLASHVNRGFSLGVGLLGAQRLPLRRAEPHSSGAPKLNAAIIGAGGCVLPCWLCGMSPFCRVVAVESSKTVAMAATKFFGTDCVGPGLSIVVQDGCAFAEASTSQCFDLLFVTAGGSSTGQGCLLAPPRAMCTDSFLRHARRLLRPGGLYAVNILGSQAASSKAVLELQVALHAVGFPTGGFHVACTSFRCASERNYILFASLVDEPVDRKGLLTRLRAGHNLWLQQLGIAEEQTEDSLVKWLTFSQFKASTT